MSLCLGFLYKLLPYQNLLSVTRNCRRLWLLLTYYTKLWHVVLGGPSSRSQAVEFAGLCSFSRYSKHHKDDE